MKRLIAIAGMIFAISIFLGSKSWGQGNEIYGCYHKDNGQLRIVSEARDCRPSEIPMSWSQIGSQGPTEANPTGRQGNAELVPRVYDANGQFLGILPNDLYGVISIYIPGLSKFISLSSDNGDADPLFPAVYLYFDGDNCTGKAYVDTNLRYQVMKIGSIYIKADDVAAECREIRSLSAPGWTGDRQCRSYPADCIPVLPYKEVTLPFNIPVALPLHIE